jgi:hypothetical protein
MKRGNFMNVEEVIFSLGIGSCKDEYSMTTGIHIILSDKDSFDRRAEHAEHHCRTCHHVLEAISRDPILGSYDCSMSPVEFEQVRHDYAQFRREFSAFQRIARGYLQAA